MLAIPWFPLVQFSRDSSRFVLNQEVQLHVIARARHGHLHLLAELFRHTNHGDEFRHRYGCHVLLAIHNLICFHRQVVDRRRVADASDVRERARLVIREFLFRADAGLRFFYCSFLCHDSSYCVASRSVCALLASRFTCFQMMGRTSFPSSIANAIDEYFESCTASANALRSCPMFPWLSQSPAASSPAAYAALPHWCSRRYSFTNTRSHFSKNALNHGVECSTYSLTGNPWDSVSQMFFGLMPVTKRCRRRYSTYLIFKRNGG